MLACVGCAWLMCPPARRCHIRWRETVAPGIAIQVILGYLVLVTEWGSAVFLALGRGAEGFLAFSYQGSDFVFSSELSATAFIAFRMLPTIVFFSCVSSLLFYLGVVQVIVDVLGPQPRPQTPSLPPPRPSLSDTLSATLRQLIHGDNGAQALGCST